MIEPLSSHVLLARMEAAQHETRSRRVNPDAHRWRLFQQHVAELTLARRGEIDALTRKLEWQELAIVALRSRHSSTAASRCRSGPGGKRETASLR